jgi:hypothetical protein
MAETTVNGKKLVMADRLPAKKHFALPRAISAPIGSLPFAEQVGPLVGTVLEWPFAGDPQSLEAWGELDDLTEFMPLWNAVCDYWFERVAALNEREKN